MWGFFNNKENCVSMVVFIEVLAIAKIFVPICFNRANLFCRGRDYSCVDEIISMLFGLRAKEPCHSYLARVDIGLIPQSHKKPNLFADYLKSNA